MDERRVSWKLLIANQSNDRVLVLGGNMGDVIGLSRTWKTLFWLQKENQTISWHHIEKNLKNRIHLIHRSQLEQLDLPFDRLFILSLDPTELDPTGLDPWNKAFLKRYLNPNGILVCMTEHISFRRLKIIKSFGLTSIKNYLTLPATPPRLFLPLSSSKALFQGLAFHTPGRQWRSGLYGLAVGAPGVV